MEKSGSKTFFDCSAYVNLDALHYQTREPKTMLTRGGLTQHGKSLKNYLQECLDQLYEEHDTGLDQEVATDLMDHGAETPDEQESNRTAEAESRIKHMFGDKAPNKMRVVACKPAAPMKSSSGRYTGNSHTSAAASLYLSVRLTYNTPPENLSDSDIHEIFEKIVAPIPQQYFANHTKGSYLTKTTFRDAQKGATVPRGFNPRDFLSRGSGGGTDAGHNDGPELRR